MIDPGKFNWRLTLEAPVEIPDGAGGVTRSHTPAAILWASLKPLAARGEVIAQAAGATVTHRIDIRYRADITIRHRFRDDDRIFRIVGMRNPDKRFLEIDVEERMD
jgi:SPP1 family predicted phage head-tail adaptor